MHQESVEKYDFFQGKIKSTGKIPSRFIPKADDVSMSETDDVKQEQQPQQVDEEQKESQNEQNQQPSKRVYIRATNIQRKKLIDLVTVQNYKIREASEMAGIGYENAKQILKVYKREGRKLTLLFKNKNNEAG